MLVDIKALNKRYVSTYLNHGSCIISLIATLLVMFIPRAAYSLIMTTDEVLTLLMDSHISHHKYHMYNGEL